MPETLFDKKLPFHGKRIKQEKGTVKEKIGDKGEGTVGVF